MRLLKFLSDSFSRTRGQRRDDAVKAEAERRERLADRKTRDEKRRARVKPQPIRVVRVNRNAKCPCGSGHKFKHCCKELLPIEYLPPKQDKRVTNHEGTNTQSIAS